MKISLNWLKKYVNIPVSAAELCDRMMMAGFEVESMEDQAAALQGVKAGVINAIERHPDADKLVVCQIDVGLPVQIVTGATNVFVGARVPVATNNTLLPTGQLIKTGKLRGVLSEGMLCSGQELCVTEEEFPGAGVDGILILPESVAPGTDIAAVLAKTDCIIDFKITPNRPDCLSVLGIAREAAAVLGQTFRAETPVLSEIEEPVTGAAKVTVEDNGLCPRYMARVIRGIKIAPSPAWMQAALLAAGMRPINNVVDITNFVMLETGQPLHAFDMRFVEGREIVVRRAKEGETLTTLDEKQHALTPEMLVIADGKKAVGLAGIMGGLNSEVLPDTSEVLLESAKFRRDNIRRTAKALGIRTESSQRFEKGIDICNVEYALNRAAGLLEALAAGSVLSGAIDTAESLPKNRVLTVAPARIEGILGIEIPAAAMQDILNALHIPTKLENGLLVCSIPSHREDITEAADLAEEVIRIYGYDKIESTPVQGVIRRGLQTKAGQRTHALKNLLCAQGFLEIVTYSFFGERVFDQLLLPKGDARRAAIRILNPLSEDYAVMRTTLAGHMLTVLGVNQNRSVDACLFFEAGKIYLPKALPLTEQPAEEPVLCLGAYGGGMDFYKFKAYVEGVLALFNAQGSYSVSEEPYLHPGRQAEVSFARAPLGVFGEVHPDALENYGLEGRVYLAEIRLAALLEKKISPVVFRPLPKYPAVSRDIALVVGEEVSAQSILDVLSRAGGKLLKTAEIFDIYRSPQLGEGKKSVAVALMFQSGEKTLAEEDIAPLMEKMLADAAKKLGAAIRQ